MKNFTIRPVKPGDLDAINRVIESAVMNWPAETRMKRLSVSSLQYDRIDLDHYEVLVGEFKGEVIAVAAWDPAAGIGPPGVAGGVFHGLYVLPIAQRQGIGEMLLNAVVEAARQRGLPGLSLKAQRVSRAFFEHQGLELQASNDVEYPWRYWKQIS